MGSDVDFSPNFEVKNDIKIIKSFPSTPAFFFSPLDKVLPIQLARDPTCNAYLIVKLHYSPQYTYVSCLGAST
jgi:hypothetical protein